MLPALSEGKTTDSETEAIEDTAVKEANEAVLDTDFSEGVNDSKAKVTVRIRTPSVIVQPTLEGRMTYSHVRIKTARVEPPPKVLRMTTPKSKEKLSCKTRYAFSARR